MTLLRIGVFCFMGFGELNN